MSLLAVLDGDFATECVMPYFDLCELFRLEAASRCTRSTVLENSALWACARRVLSKFEMGDLLATNPLMRDSRELIATLRRATVVGCVAMPLEDYSTAQALAQAVQRANGWAAAHLAAGGSVARVFVARFRFPYLGAGDNGSFDNMFANTATAAHGSAAGLRAAGAPRGAGGWPGLYPSEPVSLVLKSKGSDRHKPKHPSAASKAGGSSASSECKALSYGDKVLDLRLAWLRDSMLVNLQTKEIAKTRARGGQRADATTAMRARSTCSSRLTVDIRAISRDLILCMRSMQVDVDAGWLKGHGVCSIPRDRSATVRTLADGLPCVLCIRDSLPTEGTAPQLSSSVHALHLEVSRLHHGWYHIWV